MDGATKTEESTVAAATGQLDGRHRHLSITREMFDVDEQEGNVQHVAFDQPGLHQECAECLGVKEFQPTELHYDAAEEQYEHSCASIFSQSEVQQERPMSLQGTQEYQPLELYCDEVLEQNPIERVAVNQMENVRPNMSAEDMKNRRRGDGAVLEHQDVEGMTRLQQEECPMCVGTQLEDTNVVGQADKYEDAAIGLYAGRLHRDAVAFDEAEPNMWMEETETQSSGDAAAPELNTSQLPNLEIYIRVEVPEEDPPRVESQCYVCLENMQLEKRPCCGLPVCRDCMKKYVEMQVEETGVVRIGCPNSACNSSVFQEEIRELLRSRPELRDRYDRWLVDANADPKWKTCPRCCRITDMQQTPDRRAGKYGVMVTCPDCQFHWCFSCQSPWHEGLTCTRNREGDRSLKSWARQTQHDQRNARRCPKCKVQLSAMLKIGPGTDLPVM